MVERCCINSVLVGLAEDLADILDEHRYNLDDLGLWVNINVKAKDIRIEPFLVNNDGIPQRGKKSDLTIYPFGDLSYCKRPADVLLVYFYSAIMDVLDRKEAGDISFLRSAVAAQAALLKKKDARIRELEYKIKQLGGEP